jgi:hypothetical protein
MTITSLPSKTGNITLTRMLTGLYFPYIMSLTR